MTVEPAIAQTKDQREVQDVLQRSAAYRALEAGKRRQITDDLVRLKGVLAASPPVASAMTSGEQGTGKAFHAGARREGVESLQQLVGAVDFPQFVSGLIQGVFQAIVDASIQQMEAYGNLLSAVVKSLDQFADEHITEEQARDYLVDRYPNALQVQRGESGNRLAYRDGQEDSVNPAEDMGMEPGSVDLSEPESEGQLVKAARLEMARSRQQLLSTMVLLGINRIIVTNGRINAKVVFDMRASDTARHRATENESKGSMVATQAADVGGIGGLGWGVGRARSTSTRHTTTVRSSVDDNNESSAQLKAQLTGAVSLQFKSETFPLERMADSGQISKIQQRSTPGQSTPAAPTLAR